MKEKLLGFINPALKILKYVFGVLAVVFVSHYIFTNYAVIKKNLGEIDIIIAAISILIICLALLMQILVWHYITIIMNCELEIKQSITTKIFAEFGKYIPGKITGIVMLMGLYKQEGKSTKNVTISYIIEVLSASLGACLIFLLSLYFSKTVVFESYRNNAFLLLILFVILLNPRILNFFINLLLKFKKTDIKPVNFSNTTLLKILLLEMIVWLLFGLSLFVLINSIHPIPVSEFFYVCGSFSLSSIIGFFAIFAPAGIGVREGILIIILSKIIPPEIAGVVAVLSRLFLILAELLLFFIGILLKNAIKLRV